MTILQKLITIAAAGTPQNIGQPVGGNNPPGTYAKIVIAPFGATPNVYVGNQAGFNHATGAGYVDTVMNGSEDFVQDAGGHNIIDPSTIWIDTDANGEKVNVVYYQS